MATQSKYLSFALVCIVGIAGIAASVLWRHPAPAVELTTGTYLARARELPDFSLIDQQGRMFGSANLRGHWSLLFFGYTNCPDFCPTTLTTLAAVQKRLRAAKAPVLPQVIFVSVDAKRDTPAQLEKYVPYFDPEFIGLTAADQPSHRGGRETARRRRGHWARIRRQLHGRSLRRHFCGQPRRPAQRDPDRAVQRGEPCSVDFERIVRARRSVAGPA